MTLYLMKYDFHTISLSIYTMYICIVIKRFFLT